MDIFEFSNYREFLKAALGERMKNQPGYSLRAMARDCGLGSSTLWGALSGRSNISVEAAAKIATHLKMKAKEKTFFFDLVQLGNQKNPSFKKVILERLNKRHPLKRELSDLTVEQFKQISEWYHSAILELPSIAGFELNAKNVARALSIPQPTADVAIQRLLKLGLLESTDDGKIKPTQTHLHVQSEIKNAAFRQFYRGMLEKASKALETQSPQERISGYATIPVSHEDIKEVDAAVDRFLEELRSISENGKEKSDVYHLAIHFFNLTKKK